MVYHVTVKSVICYEHFPMAGDFSSIHIQTITIPMSLLNSNMFLISVLLGLFIIGFCDYLSLPFKSLCMRCCSIKDNVIYI